jgi:hypothetical protein
MGGTLYDRAKWQFENLKILSEELRVQMALGRAEARDSIEKERKALYTYFSKQKIALEKANEKHKEGRREFLTCVENLKTSLHDEVPVSSEDYDKYKSNVLKHIYELEEEVRQNYPLMNLTVQSLLDSFKVKMDAFRVNLALHDVDNPDKVEKIKKEFSEKLEDVRKLLSKRENRELKVDNFIENISTSFDHLKQAILELSK